MRRLILAVVFTSGAGWALAQDPQAQPPTQPQQQSAPAAKDTKEMTAVVVATDPTVKTIKLVLKTDAMGKESVTSIEKSKSATPEK